MDEKLEKSLRHIQKNPAGLAHQRELISTQVETIFMLDGLKAEIIKLKETIVNLSRQDRALSRAMLVLTAIGTLFASLSILNLIFSKDEILKSIEKILPAFAKLPTADILAGVGSFLVAIFTFFIARRFVDRGDVAKPVFYNFFREKPRILAVHKYEKSDSEVSGYKHLGQNSRPDQREKLIKVNKSKSLFGIRYEIEPLNKDDILTVIISKNGRENWKSISFNKDQPVN